MPQSCMPNAATMSQMVPQGVLVMGVSVGRQRSGLERVDKTSETTPNQREALLDVARQAGRGGWSRSCMKSRTQA